MPKVSKNKRAAKERAVNYSKSENGRHFASKCLESYPMGKNYSSSPKTVKRIDAEAPLEVEEISIIF
jgi:hypothetical protein